MKHLFLGAMLLTSLINSAMQNAPELTICNSSSQTVTVYYKNGITRYTEIQPMCSHTIMLQLPQKLTVHFNELNWQQNIDLHTHAPLHIRQHQNTLHANVINVAQDKKSLFHITHFD